MVVYHPVLNGRKTVVQEDWLIVIRSKRNIQLDVVSIAMEGDTL